MIHGHLLENGELYVDNSLLSQVAKCDTAAYLRYAQDLVTDEESKYLVAGKAVHKALEAHCMGVAPAAALAVLQAEYEDWARQYVPDDDRLAYANVRKVVGRWIETHPLAELPFTIDPASIERSYAVELADGIILTVRPDIADVRMKSTGMRCTLDHKTTGRIAKEWSEQFRDSSQVSTQLFVGQHDETPPAGVLINAIELSKVPTSNRKCKDHGVAYHECADMHVKYEFVGPIQRRPDQLQQWKSTAIRLAKHYRDDLLSYPLERIDQLPQQGQFTGACTYCAYKDFCRLGRPVNMIDTMFKREPWEPFREEAVTSQTA